ncbi:MAG: ribosome-associated translation inhibitor RaiA, partial [Clostridia bacterium]|nr:ribosome-associated translation inhibitor RaiA [Clostridia bacterium]
LDDNLKNLIEKKLAKFDKYFDNTAKAKVKLSSASDLFKMEITISQGSLIVRSIASGDKMNENIDVVLPKLERQIIKYKDKISSKMKKGAFETPFIYVKEPEKEEPKQIVKVKKFNVSVTTIENAAEEMELLAHDFYVFINGDTNKLCVLYKRHDGDLGLIEPEY